MTILRLFFTIFKVISPNMYSHFHCRFAPFSERRISPSKITFSAAQYAFGILSVCRHVFGAGNMTPCSPSHDLDFQRLQRMDTWWWLNIDSSKNQIHTPEVLTEDNHLGATAALSACLSLRPSSCLWPSHHLLPPS